jgi:hypothetical protein
MDEINLAERAMAGISGGTGKADTLAQLRNLRASFDSLEARHSERGQRLLTRIDEQINLLAPPKLRIVFIPRFPFVGRR